MAQEYYTPVNLKGNELREARVQNLPTAPTPAGKGHLYFDDTAGDNTLYWWDGTKWVSGRGGEEVWIGNDAPADTAVELWYDPDAPTPLPPGSDEVWTGDTAPVEPHTYELWIDVSATPPVIYAWDATTATWVPVSAGGGGGGGTGTDEVWIGTDDPIAANPTIELWVDTDEPDMLGDPDQARWNSAWGVIAHRKNTTTGSPDVGTVAGDVWELGVEFLPVAGRRYRTTVDWLALAQPRRLGIISGTAVVTTDAAGTATIRFPETYDAPPYSLVVNNGDGGAVAAMTAAPLVINPDQATVRCCWADSGAAMANATLRLNWVGEIIIGPQIVVPRILDGAGTTLQQRNQTMFDLGTYFPIHVEHIDENLPAVATIRKASWSADRGYVSFVTGDYFPAYITVEDIGPVTMSSPPPELPPTMVTEGTWPVIMSSTGTNQPVFGNSVVNAYYQRIGQWCSVEISVQFGSSYVGSAGGQDQFDLPFPAAGQPTFACKLWMPLVGWDMAGSGYIVGRLLRPLFGSTPTDSDLAGLHNADATAMNGTGNPRTPGYYTMHEGGSILITARYLIQAGF